MNIPVLLLLLLLVLQVRVPVLCCVQAERHVGRHLAVGRHLLQEPTMQQNNTPKKGKHIDRTYI